MTAHQTSTLIIRLLGVVWFLYLLGHVGGIATYMSGEPGIKPGTGFVVVLSLVQFVGCAAFWLLPATIAAKLLPSTLSNKARPASTPLEWQTLGVICIGLWELSRAIPDGVYWLTFLDMAEQSGLSGNSFAPSQKANMYATIVEFVIGLSLLFGGKGTAAILFRVRTAGLRPERTEPGEDRPG
jgi:hypothetical protein